MQLARKAAPLSVLLLVLAANPAQAGICTLVLLNSGVLAMSADGTRLSSQETGGLAATLTVLSVGASTLTVGAPTITQSAPGHNAGSDIVEVSYAGVGLLAGVNSPYTTSQTTAPIPNLASAVAVTFNNRVTSSTGFTSGTYQTRTVVTCS